MKRILLLSLLLLPIIALAQYPTFSNKQKLGVQTTGDGLIFRGGIHPNYYTPSNINNAYFYLDTTTSKLYLYNDITWQQIYPTASDTLSLGAYLLKSDTSAMLLPYLRKSDTISLSNRINNKLSLADTASMLLPYLKLADTTSMLAPYFRDSDTTMLNLITRFNSKLNTTDTVSLSNRINLKLNNTDTINLSNRIDLKLNKSDTISLSNRIDIKLNASDTVSLSNRINKKLDTLYINYPTYIDTITNKDTIQIAPSLVLTEGFGINVIGDSINIDSAVILATQQKQIAYVKNQSEVTIYKGQAVYSSGSSGNNKLVTLASSATEQSSSKTFGVVETDSIPNGGHGYIITFGLLSGINTDALNEGSSVYLSSTSGQLTSVKPIAPLHLVTIGVCIRKQQNNGSIFVKIQNGFEFDELHDVQIIDPVNKASLYYNSSENLWRDTTAALLVSDTASMLSKYVNTYSNQTGINGDKTFNNVVTIDSATVTGKLLVNTNISDAVKISSNTNSTNLELMNSSGTVSIKSSNKNMILQTDTTALVYLNGDNKKVGILTMNPQQALQVAGNIRIDSLNNNLVPLRIVGSNNNNDLTNVNLGQGLSFSNDTLKVDLTIIDTAIAASSITLVGNVTGSGSTNSNVNTTISNGVVTNDMLAGGISDTKLNTITTAGKISNTATTATNSNTINTIVSRDALGNFSAGTITANLNGNANTVTTNANLTGDITSTGNATSIATGIIVNDDINASAAIAVSKLAASTISGVTLGNNLNTLTISSPLTGTSYNGSSAVSIGIQSASDSQSGIVTTSSQLFAGSKVFKNKVTVDSVLTLNTTTAVPNQILGINTVGNVNSVGKFTLGNGLSIVSSTLFADTNLLVTVFDTSSMLTPYFRDADTTSLNLTSRFAAKQNTLSNASASVSGILTSTDWNTFNNKQTAIAFAPPLQNQSNVVTISQASSTDNGYLSISDWNTFNNKLNLSDTASMLTNYLRTGTAASTYLTQSNATSTYLPLTGGTLTGTINRQEGSHDGSASTFYYNILNYFARQDNIKYNPTAQITFTDRPGTSTFPNNARTSDIYLMTARNWNGTSLGQYLDTTLSVVANQDGGRVGISKLNPSYKLDVNGTFNASGNSLIGGTLNVTGDLQIGNNLGRSQYQILTLGGNAINEYGWQIARSPQSGGVINDGMYIYNLKNNSVPFVISLTDNIGIGTTNPLSKLEVHGSAVFNESSAIADFRVESDGNANMLFVDGTNNRVGIGTNTPDKTLDVNGELNVLSAGTFGGRVNTPWIERQYTSTTATSLTVSINTTWLNIHQDAAVTLTLPNAATYPGKELIIKQTGAGIVSSSGTPNIIGFTTAYNGSPQSVIINPSIWRYVTLVSDGTNWVTMQRNN